MNIENHSQTLNTVKTGKEVSENIEPIYWCDKCNVPLLSEKCNKCGSIGSYCANDLKPVFDKEKETYEKFLLIKLPDGLFRNRNRIILDGKTLFRYKIDFNKLKLSSIEPKSLIKSRLSKHKSIDKNRFWRKIRDCNVKFINRLEREAIKFIRNTAKEHNDKLKVVSFSGGKDSTVTAILVKKALTDVPLFFSDTTLEFPETYNFVEEFAKQYNFKLIKDENDKFFRSKNNFFDLCDDLGPPSISYRWCCTVFKAYPVNEFYKTIEGDVLAFDGIRNHESFRRTKYTKVSRISKIPRQVAAYPIFSWREADVWIYILLNKLIYNPMYNLGHTRVGCWTCPNASPSNCFFRKLTHPKLWKTFETKIDQYADEHDKPRKWVIENYWRLRRSKKDKIIGASSVRKLSSERNVTYKLKEPFNADKLEFFKPFGDIKINHVCNGTSFSVHSKNPFDLNGVLDGKILKVDIGYNPPEEGKRIFEKQLSRALNCVGCGGCVGKCPNGAINIINKKFSIDEAKCTRCKKCVFESCIALNYRTEQKIIKNN